MLTSVTISRFTAFQVFELREVRIFLKWEFEFNSFKWFFSLRTISAESVSRLEYQYHHIMLSKSAFYWTQASQLVFGIAIVKLFAKWIAYLVSLIFERKALPVFHLKVLSSFLLILTQTVKCKVPIYNPNSNAYGIGLLKNYSHIEP